MVDHLPKYLGMVRPIRKKHLRKAKPIMVSDEINLKGQIKDDQDSSCDMIESAKLDDFFMLKHKFESILNYLRYFTQLIKEDQLLEEESLDWKFAAMAIDRLCVYIFAFATFISTALILLGSPNLYKSSDPDPIF